MLTVNNFKKSYGERPVVSAAHIVFQQGIHWIKGHNGSGKTTFFKCIAGLLPFEGTIELNTQPVLDLKKQGVAYRKAVNFGEAEPLYPSYLSGGDILQFVARAKGASAGDVAYLTETIQISPYLEKPVGSYSSGMLKKLSLALAFVGQPKLIILDEPLITIDAQAVEIICALIKHYHEQKQVGFLISSHQLFEAQNLAFHSQYEVRDGVLHLC